MPGPTNVNIRQLNQIEEIVSGNFLLVETDKGTQLIDFANFVAGPNNVSFYSDFTALCANVVALSGYISTSISTLSSQSDANLASQIAGLSSTINQTYSKVFYASGTLTFDINDLVSSAIPIDTPPNVTLTPADINLTFLTTVISSVSTTPINVFPLLYGSAPSYALQAELTVPAYNAITVGYNIFKPY
jgi:hypothetical protein